MTLHSMTGFGAARSEATLHAPPEREQFGVVEVEQGGTQRCELLPHGALHEHPLQRRRAAPCTAWTRQRYDRHIGHATRDAHADRFRVRVPRHEPCIKPGRT